MLEEYLTGLKELLIAGSEEDSVFPFIPGEQIINTTHKQTQAGPHGILVTETHIQGFGPDGQPFERHFVKARCRSFCGKDKARLLPNGVCCGIISFKQPLFGYA